MGVLPDGHSPCVVGEITLPAQISLEVGRPEAGQGSVPELGWVKGWVRIEGWPVIQVRRLRYDVTGKEPAPECNEACQDDEQGEDGKKLAETIAKPCAEP